MEESASLPSTLSSSLLFPDCVYPSIHSPEMCAEDTQRYAIIIVIAKEVRKLFRLLVQEEINQIFETQYSNILDLLHSLNWRMIPWCLHLKTYFDELKKFLAVNFLVKESDGVTQHEYLTNLSQILSNSAHEHVHSYCPFHMEDNFTHCFLTMMASITDVLECSSPSTTSPPSSFSYYLFQKGVCALLHDIGKENTKCISKKKNGDTIVAYPCHCVVGSIILRHIWGDYFSQWFHMNEWDMMCDTVLYHMCGCNRDPDPLCITFLAHLPSPLRNELYHLGRADVRGGLPMQNYIFKVPPLGNDLDACNSIELLAEKCQSFEEMFSGKLFGANRPSLKGVLIVLMGTSGCGKSYTANLIRQTLVDYGVREDLIHHLQRDEFILTEGAKLLGKNPHEITYREAYEEITRVHDNDKLQGKEGIKSKISSQMKEVANSLLLRGHIVLLDTMQTYFSHARMSILPSAATNSFRLYIYPVRTTLLSVQDSTRHDMNTETQIRTSGPFSILSPFSNEMKGTKHQSTSLSQLKIIGAVTTPSTALYSQSPHYQLTISTVTRENQQLPNSLFFWILNMISLCKAYSLPIMSDLEQTPSLNMNLSELLDTLESQFDQNFITTLHENQQIQTRIQKISLLKKWFDENQYSMTLPFYQIYLRAKYSYETKIGNIEESLLLKSKISEELLPTEDFISSQSLQDLTHNMKHLEALTYSCIIIKYKDGINRQWSAPWHIQSRSPICMFIHNHWKVISAMPRGPEVAGDKEHGVTTLQDVDISDENTYSHFAPHYQTIIKGMKGHPIEMTIPKIVCSSKRDGMCFRVLALHSSTPEGNYWQRAVKFIQDPFVTTFIQISRKYLKGSLLLIPASNGTAFLTQSGVQYWMACSIALSYGITHSELLALASSSSTTTTTTRITTPADVLLLPLPQQTIPRQQQEQGQGDNDNDDPAEMIPQTVIEAFVYDIIKANNSKSQHLSLNKMHTWEAIGGPNRMCAFDSSPHVELACSYSEGQCGISYLGYSITTLEGDLEWIPHFDISHPFYEPIYWEMNSFQECITALRDLSQVFSGISSWDHFYSLYTPSNTNPLKTFQPDPEGFVSYFLMSHFKSSASSDSASASASSTSSQLNYIYCKTKTWLYYLMHKIRIKDIPMILTLPHEFGHSFPAYQQIKSFFSEEGQINLIRMLQELCELIENDENLRNDIPIKAVGAIQRPNQSKEVIFRIILCNSQQVWRQKSIQIASKYFAAFGSKSRGTSSDSGTMLSTIEATPATMVSEEDEGPFILKALLLELQCFRSNWEENVSREFNFQTISVTHQLSPIAGRLWNYLHSNI